ncbi:MAG: diguanylate cyclase [Gammaproteobacteria bacterium]|nr:diguanylate cyclase [Gammaproteobacteria bacterium]
MLDLKQKWFGNNGGPQSSAVNHLTLTLVESNWLKEHPIIRVANESDWPPFDYVEYGKPKGFAIDYMNLLSKKIGIDIEYVNRSAWSELVNLFKQKKIDVMPVFYRNNEREQYTLYTPPYYRGKLGIMINKDSLFTQEELVNKKVAMQKSDGSIRIVNQQMPDINVIELDNSVDLVHSLATKQVDAIIGNPLLFNYYIKEEQVTNIKLLGYISMDKKEQLNASLHIGVRNDLPVLHQIIIKAMDSITEEEFSSIEKKWTNIKVVNQVDWKLIGQIVIVIVIIILFLIWNNYRLKTIVAIKTAELRKLNEELEIKVELRTKELSHLNIELKKQAQTDSLTGAYNRRYLFNIANQIMEISKREKSSLSVAMIDIDKFKNINDTFGHDIGDKVIQHLVKEVSKNLRSADILSRFGGEEFLIVFPTTNSKGALLATENIRNKISRSNIKEVSYTISAGVSEVIEEDVDIHDVIKRADKALYKAKNNGRNRIEFY